MTTTDESNVPNAKWMDSVGAFVCIFITTTEIFITVAPYFGLSPNGVDSAISSQQNTIMQNVFISIVSFLIGASVGTRKKDDTIKTAVEASAKAAAAITPPATTTTTIKTETTPPPATVALAVVRPSWISPEDWAKMTDDQKLVALAKGQP